jgi:FkbM family methyltransferase
MNNLNRFDRALFVRRNAVNDFFGGWEEDDIKLLEKYKKPIGFNANALDPGYIYDWLGVKTLHKFHQWLKMKVEDSAQILELPVPDDQIHAETIEYVALLLAIERAKKIDDYKFTVFEFGASYAPWAIASGVVAKRNGFNIINLNAVEVSASMLENAKMHAKINGMENSFNLIHGAVALNDGFVFFPKIDVQTDNGAQISDYANDLDYRGLRLNYDKVKSYCTKTLLLDHDRIDFLHMDLQGAEAKLLIDQSFLNTITSKVSTLFLATQSRLIEGVALEELSNMGWLLLRERPTTYQQNTRTKDINGWTLRDGGQIWINPKYTL